MNTLTPAKKTALRLALKRGLSVRDAASEVGCSKVTVSRYLALWEVDRGTCPCGFPNGHKGWCRTRVALSPARSAWLAHWHVDQREQWHEMLAAAAVQAKANGHVLGRFMWSGQLVASVANTKCVKCGAQVHVMREHAEGRALRDVCETEEQRQAWAEAQQEKRAWQSAARTLKTIRKTLRDRRQSPPEGSAPAPTSRG